SRPLVSSSPLSRVGDDMHEMRRMGRPLVAVALGLMFATAAATDIDINDQRAFSQQRTVVAEELAEGKKYAEIEQEELRRVNTLLASMAEIVERSPSIVSLT